MADAVAKKARPKYLGLRALVFEIRLPLPGWVSILHRVSGALLFLATAWLLWLLDLSLENEAGFESVRRLLAQGPAKLVLLVLLWAYCHHFCAGLRFLALDLHLGTDRRAARASSVAVFAVSLAATAVLGAMLW